LPPRKWTIWAVAAIAAFLLYFFGLDRTGMLSADEPRYAAIGRAMAQSGDWVTPRLFGQPWFEKPALLYWMTAAGFKLGLGDDLAPRIPVAIVSVAFLIFFFFWLRTQFGETAAFLSTCILGTCAGWLAFSHVAVTDLPLAAAFSAAMLLILSESWLAAGILLGLAILAKGLVPLALFLPAIWFLRRRPKGVFVVVGVAILVALPWYALVTARNGSAFLEEFFWKHHFERFATGALMHVRPFWFYAPVLLAGLFPWTPTLALLFRRDLYRDRRIAFLAAWAAFGFVFFSASENKLPGYLLPLLPAIAALCGIRLAKAGRVEWLLAACALLLFVIPVIQPALPQALISGLSQASVSIPFIALLPVVAIAALCWLLEHRGHRSLAVGVIGACMVVAVTQIVWKTYPVLDRTVSARQFYRDRGDSIVCSSNPNRSWRYGLDYYAHRPIPDCK